MIKLFQRNIALQAVLTLVALLLLWGSSLLAPPSMDAGDHPAVLYSLLCRWLNSLPRLAVVIAMLLVLVEGVMLNLLLANEGLVSQNSLLPTLLYVVVTSAGATTLTPIILVNALAIAVLDQLMLRGTLLTIPTGKACGATLLIGAASLFYQPAALLLLSYLLIAANYRLYTWKDWCVMLLGFAAPYITLALVLYMTDGLASWWNDTVACFTSIDLHLGTTGTATTIGGAVLAAVFVWSLLHVGSRLGERPVLWQRNAATVMLFAVGAAGMLFFAPLLPLRIALFALPFTFCSYRLLTCATETTTGFGRRKKRTWIYDTLLILIIIAALLC